MKEKLIKCLVDEDEYESEKFKRADNVKSYEDAITILKIYRKSGTRDPEPYVQSETPEFFVILILLKLDFQISIN